MKRLLACYGKTRQGVIEKEKFVMPSFTQPNPSTTTTSTSGPSNVSIANYSLRQFVDAFCSRFEELHKLTRALLIDMSMRLGDDKGKKLARDYYKGTPNASSSVAQIENPQYGMLLNYFAGQSPPPGSVRPTTAELVRLV